MKHFEILRIFKKITLSSSGFGLMVCYGTFRMRLTMRLYGESK